MTAKPIVVATDGSGASLRAVGWAAREAVLHRSPLRIVGVAAAPLLTTPGSAPADYDWVADFLASERDRALDAAAREAAQVGEHLRIDIRVLDGPPAQTVAASGSGALMLVVGSHGAGAFAAMLLGSVSRYAAAHASCPVMVIRDDAEVQRGQIGVGIGDPDDCAEALSFAFEEASLRQAQLVAVHAWHTPQTGISPAGQAFPVAGLPNGAEPSRGVSALLEEWRDKYPNVPVSQEVVHGHPAMALAGLSARADLVLIGRRTRHPEFQGPGSVRHALLNHAHGPVGVVPAE